MLPLLIMLVQGYEIDRSAFALGDEGRARVVVEFATGERGRITSCRIVRSSGNPMADADVCREVVRTLVLESRRGRSVATTTQQLSLPFRPRQPIETTITPLD